jgi:tagatose 1,6-diphosphate aldolase
VSLAGISDGGRFGVLAIDHRDSMRAVLAPGDPDSVSAGSITDLKRELVGALADGATGVMLEPEYSIPQLLDGTLPDGVGFTAALEAQGYASDPEASATEILEGWSVQAAADSGASAAKLLVFYRPDRPGHAAVQERVVAEILAECRRVGVPLVLEPLFYGLDDPSARRGLVIGTVERFAAMDPHLLKLPFPVDPAYERDRGVWAEACAEIAARCHMPWTVLSGGGGYESYRDQVESAVAAGCSGFMAGRALWGEAVLAPPADRAGIIADVVAPRLAELRSIVG